MCNPLAIGAAVAQGGMSFIGQRQAAEAQEKAQRNATIAEQQRYLQEVSAQRIAQRQEEIAAAQRINESAKKAREARATARVSAGESGVSGISVDSVINDLTRQQAEYDFSIQQQLDMSQTNRALGLQDAAMRSKNNLLTINRPIAQPSLLGSAFEGAMTGLSVYSTANRAGFGQSSKVASTGTSVSDVAKMSQKPKNMGMLDLPQYNQLFKSYG